ncbi:potassium-transporting ATPase subunit KdpA [Microbispora siamensis]
MSGWLLAAVVIIALVVLHVPLGDYLARAYTGSRHWRLEKAIYRFCGVDPRAEQRWPHYLKALLTFSAAGVLLLYAILRLQPALPLSLGHPAFSPAAAFNTAVSFTTNTSWQSYAGESAMGHFALAAGLGVQAFASAAVGMAVALALIRGLVRSGTDLNLDGVHATAATLTGSRQRIPGGPVGSWESIKLLSGDGGGFFNAGSAHPFENPTPVSNLIEITLMPLIPAGFIRMYGRLVGDRRQGWTLLAVAGTLFGLLLAGVSVAEARHGGTVPSTVGAAIEGKEVRFGVPGSAPFAVAATATADGAANSSYDSFTSLGGGVLMFAMMLGEISPGGCGSGLYGLLIISLVAVFVGGLMVGRTPEYLGKRIGAREIKMAALYQISTPAVVLAGSAVSVGSPTGRTAVGNTGAHGLSEIVYAFTSSASGNGSAFAGLNGGTTFYDVALAIVMLVGRYLPIAFVVALAGSLAGQRPVPVTSGTLPTHGPVFALMTLGTALIVSGLSYLPVLSLGPLADGLHRTLG